MIPSLPLVIRSPNWLGDAIMTLPAVSNLKKLLGSAPLTVAAPSSVAAVWEACDFVDSVIRLPQAKKLWLTSRQLAAGQFKSALLFPNSLRVALEARLAGIPHIIGYGGRGREYLGINTHARRPFDMKRWHQKYDWLHLAAACGADPEERPIRLRLPSTSEKTPAEAPIIICPGAEYGSAKRWPEANYVILAQHLISKYSLPILFMGTQADALLGAELAKRVPGSLNLCGKTTLHDFMIQLTQARLVIGNDSGGLHLTSVLGVPGIAIFGSTEPRLTGPLGSSVRVLRHHLPCSPCFLRECPIGLQCLHSIPPSLVLEACDELLAQS